MSTVLAGSIFTVAEIYVVSLAGILLLFGSTLVLHAAVCLVRDRIRAIGRLTVFGQTKSSHAIETSNTSATYTVRAFGPKTANSKRMKTTESPSTIPQQFSPSVHQDI